MKTETEAIRQESQQILKQWLTSCTRGGKVSRNTVAVGIVVLNHLRRGCPVSRNSAVSEGGEIKGARSGLGPILERYGVPARYLGEVTTRQGHQDGQKLLDALDWGGKLAALPLEDRDSLLLELVSILSRKANDWLQKKNLRLAIDRRQAPLTWAHLIVENAKGRSGGVVEQHLVGAKLEKRFRNIEIPNHPAHAGDRQTAREGDFAISGMVYHVTATPSRNVILKCADNIQVGKHPILLVPSEQEYRAKALALEEQIDKQVSIISIEAFLALNIIELSAEEGKDFFGVLQEIVQIYNRRLAAVETDLSLQIEVH